MENSPTKVKQSFIVESARSTSSIVEQLRSCVRCGRNHRNGLNCLTCGQAHLFPSCHRKHYGFPKFKVWCAPLTELNEETGKRELTGKVCWKQKPIPTQK